MSLIIFIFYIKKFNRISKNKIQSYPLITSITKGLKHAKCIIYFLISGFILSWDPNFNTKLKRHQRDDEIFYSQKSNQCVHTNRLGV